VITDAVGSTDDAPPPAGPYSQSRRRGQVVACAGQAGIRPDGEFEKGFEPQLRRTFDNLRATLAAAGADFGDVVQVRIFLTDPGQFAEMNSIYADYFSPPYPARTTVTVVLPNPLLVEADMLAIIVD